MKRLCAALQREPDSLLRIGCLLLSRKWFLASIRDLDLANARMSHSARIEEDLSVYLFSNVWATFGTSSAVGKKGKEKIIVI